MTTLPAYTPSAFGSSGYHNRAASLSFQYAESTAVAHKAAQEITLYTTEGDRVTLSAAQQTSAVYTRQGVLDYRQSLAADEAATVSTEQLVAFKGESLQLADARTMTLSVDGDLNDAELADIKKALVQIDRIMRQQLRGQAVEKGVKQAESLLDLDTLAGVEADYSYETVVVTQHAAALEQQVGAHGAPAPRQDPVERMADILEASRVDLPKFKSPLQQLFARINADLKDQMKADYKAVKELLQLSNRFQGQLLSRIGRRA
ncbi:MAG: hypothetical protein GY697_09305 [Desulfobacterales bacterium]|nr:hypothetical protein [Desulfobacterales bacterium]